MAPSIQTLPHTSVLAFNTSIDHVAKKRRLFQPSADESLETTPLERVGNIINEQEPEQGQFITGVPPHPLGIKPSGNAYDAKINIKSSAGFFALLPDELLLQLLEHLTATDLLRLGSTCKALYAFSAAEELWKALFIEYVLSAMQELLLHFLSIRESL